MYYFFLLTLGCLCSLPKSNTAAPRFESRLQFQEVEVTTVCLNMRLAGKVIPQAELVATLTSSAKTASELIASVTNAFKTSFKNKDLRRAIRLIATQEALEKDALAYAANAFNEQKEFLLTLLNDYPGMRYEVALKYAAISPGG
ncbi:hypothetical protein FJ365_03395 [Candidatus Dependentiae bacterium]|nr:hypothetical protein [Candidatus Dependentiae bacterium]